MNHLTNTAAAETSSLGQRVRRALTTPPAIPAEGDRLKTNLDTDFLKLIAIVSMLIDHIGGAFFPEVGSSAGSAVWPSPSSATVSPWACSTPGT